MEMTRTDNMIQPSYGNSKLSTPKMAGPAGRTLSPHKAGLTFNFKDTVVKYPDEATEWKCIHEICTCEKHKCPGHGKKAHVPFDGTTMYNQDYVEKPLGSRPPPVAPAPYVTTPFAGESTNRADFLKWDLPERERALKAPPPKSLPFDGNTAYRQDYDRKEIERVQGRQREAWKPNPAAFDGTTTAMEFYDEKPLPEKVPQAAQGAYKSLPFEGDTLYRQDYQKWQLEEQRKMEKQKAVCLPESRDFLTEARQEYTNKPLTPAQIRQREVWKGSGAKLQSETTNRADYTEKELEKRAYQQKQAGPMATLPFEGTTTNREDYLRWQLPEHAARPKQAPPKTLKFEGRTMYRSEFDEKPMEKQERRAREEWKAGGPRFDGTTTNRVDYDEKPLEARAPPGALPKHVPLPFEGDTLYRQDYQRWEVEQRKAADKQVYKCMKDDRDFATNYRTEHYHFPVERCPVHDLPRYPNHQVEANREHLFWNERDRRWC
eukprot:Platyproteum_vivax@DN6651_c0_g1_i2.p1